MYTLSYLGSLHCFCHILNPEKAILSDPVLQRSDEYYLSREEHFDRVVKKYARFNVIKRVGKFTDDETPMMRM